MALSRVRAFALGFSNGLTSCRIPRISEFPCCSPLSSPASLWSLLRQKFGSVAETVVFVDLCEQDSLA